MPASVPARVIDEGEAFLGCPGKPIALVVHTNTHHLGTESVLWYKKLRFPSLAPRLLRPALSKIPIRSPHLLAPWPRQLAPCARNDLIPYW